MKTWKDIDGWFDFQDVYESVVRMSPTNPRVDFVEVGVWLGKSTIFMLDMITKHRPNIHLHVVDTWKGNPGVDFMLEQVAKAGGSLLPNFIQNVKDCGYGNLLDKSLHIHEGLSVEVAETFKEKSVSFVFIDGDHSYQAVKDDILAWKPKIRKGGRIAGHDYNPSNDSYKGLIQAVQECCPDFYPTSTSCWVEHL